jgi:hypothetical protein
MGQWEEEKVGGVRMRKGKGKGRRVGDGVIHAS